MTFAIEVHSLEDRIIGSRTGTHEGRGLVHDESKLWPTLSRLATQRTWYRAYVIHNTNTVVCVVARDGDQLYRVGHTEQCNIGQSLPYLLDPPAIRVVSKAHGIGFRTVSERNEWLYGHFQRADTATAVLLQGGRVHYAWERPATTGGEIQLVANGRREAPAAQRITGEARRD